ncbi:hypothetical protein PENTCL1PPCAC_5143, partial [Pristionchus entomophagus]
ATHPCKLYTLPSAAEGSCEITINYNARDDKQALATCLEFFPKTFVKGEKAAEGTTKCVVTAAYQCVEDDPGTPRLSSSFSTSAIDSRRMEVANTSRARLLNTCLPMRMIRRRKAENYSYTHAKFVGMEAHRKDIDKLWIGIDKHGKELEGEKRMMHSTMWNHVEVSPSTTSCGRAPTTCTIGGR